MVLGGDNFVSEVALSGQVDIGHRIFHVDASAHFTVKGLLSSCFHCMAINI